MTQAASDSLWAERAAREYRRRLASLPLLDFVPRVSPDLDRPSHLTPLVELFERAVTEGDVRAVSSVPPQHGKSVTLFHLLVRELLRNPRRRHGYGTYSIDFARSQSDKALAIARRAQVPFARVTRDEWTTPQGGGIVWTGVGGALTGKPIDGVFVADDLLKNRADAESPAVREATHGFLTSTVLTRLHPGASLILNATRWHADDPSGRRAKAGWPVVNLPAVNDNGEPLWPTRRPLEWLLEQKRDVGEYDWYSLYQGNPRPKGGTVFKDAHYYDSLPTGGYREAAGIDFAYTARAHADYSVAIAGRIIDGTIYLTDLYRGQVEAPQFGEVLKAWGIRHMLARIGGTEKGIIQFLRKDQNLRITTINATTDKFAFAQPAAAWWNAGRILIPKNAPWANAFLDEILNFTGLGDPNDDQVDALGALHHALVVKPRPNAGELRAAAGV